MEERLKDTQYHGSVLGEREVAGFQLVEAVYAPRQRVPNHCHVVANFCIAIQGRCIESYGGKVREYKPLTLDFLPPNHEHSLSFHAAALRCFSIDIPAHWLERMREYSLPVDESVHSHGCLLAELFMKLYKEFRHADQASSLAVEGLVLEMLAEVSRQRMKITERKTPRWLENVRDLLHPGDAVDAGVDVISHSVDLAFETLKQMPATSQEATYRALNWESISADSPAITALLKRMSRRGTMLDDTVIHTHLRLVPALSNREAARPEKERKTTYPTLVDDWAFNVTRRAHQLGVLIVTGTDFQEQPRKQDFPNIHTEMELLVSRCGLTPLEAITAATQNGAKALGIQNLYGTIRKGRVADLIVLSADPSRDIRNTTIIVYVIKGGKLHKREKVTMPAN